MVVVNDEFLDLSADGTLSTLKVAHRIKLFGRDSVVSPQVVGAGISRSLVSGTLRGSVSSHVFRMSVAPLPVFRDDALSVLLVVGTLIFKSPFWVSIPE